MSLQIWEVACGGYLSPSWAIPVIPGVAHLPPATHRLLAYRALLATCRESRVVALATYEKGTFHPKLRLRKPRGVSRPRKAPTSIAARPASGSGATVHQGDDNVDEDDGDMTMVHVRFAHQLIDPLLYVRKGLRWGDYAETVSRRRQWWADRASEAAARDVPHFQQPTTASLARGRELGSRRQQQATNAPPLSEVTPQRPMLPLDHPPQHGHRQRSAWPLT